MDVLVIKHCTVSALLSRIYVALVTLFEWYILLHKSLLNWLKILKFSFWCYRSCHCCLYLPSLGISPSVFSHKGEIAWKCDQSEASVAVLWPMRGQCCCHVANARPVLLRSLITEQWLEMWQIRGQCYCLVANARPVLLCFLIMEQWLDNGPFKFTTRATLSGKYCLDTPPPTSGTHFLGNREKTERLEETISIKVSLPMNSKLLRPGS